MFLPALLASLALAQTDPPQLRVDLAGLDFARFEDRAAFRSRLADAAGVFCDQHRALVTPTHVRARGWCEREMSAEAVFRLPRKARLALRSDRGRP